MTVVLNGKTVRLKSRGSKFTIVKMIEPWAKFNVRVLSDNESMGLAYGSGSYREGTEVLIRAEAKAGYKFTRWSDGSLDTTRLIVVEEDITLTAIFERDSSMGVLRYNPNQVYRETNII